MKIGLIGAPGVGKDAVISELLVKKYNYIQLAFADHIKECYYKYNNITEEYFKSCRGTPKETEIRQGLWEFSDKMKEKNGDFHFISPIINKAKNIENVVISDIRTIEELVCAMSIHMLIIVIKRGKFKKEKNFPGTRISNIIIDQFLTCEDTYLKPYQFYKFDNDFVSLDVAREQFDIFYKRRILMDPDSHS